MLRFSTSRDSSSHSGGPGKNRVARSLDRSSITTRLRLPLMFVALLLVLAARARLQQPAVHQAIGQILEGPNQPVTPAETPAEIPTDEATDETPAGSMADSMANTKAMSKARDGETVSKATFSQQLLATIRDNTPFRSDEQEAWFAMLAKLKVGSYETQASQSLGAVGYATLISDPDAYRGKFVTIVGIPRRSEIVTPAENDLDIEQLYRITLEPVGGEVWPITIYSLSNPRLLRDDSNGDNSSGDNLNESEAISTTGYFFKNQSYRWSGGIGSMPVIVAKDISRTVVPTTSLSIKHSEPLPEPDFKIDQSVLKAQASLGRALLDDLGVNLDSLGGIKDQKTFNGDETETFYAILNGVKKTPARQLARLAEGGLASYAARHGLNNKVRPGENNRQAVMRQLISKEAQQGNYSAPILFGKVADQRGELFSFDGIVRRVVRIEVPDREIGHYYELELFPQDSQNLPLVFCVAELPNGFPVGEAIRQPARLVGFFFKQWAYRSRNRASDGATDQRRFAPLLIGRSPLPLASPEVASNRPGWVVGAFGIGLLMMTFLGIWAFGRSDKTYEKRVTARLRESATGDFSHLP